MIEWVCVLFQLVYGYVETDDDKHGYDRSLSSIARTTVLLYPIPYRNVMRCVQLVALYDTQEDVAAVYSSPEPIEV